MTYGEKRKSVTFNLDREDEREMYELAKRVNFGRLVKKYLAMELEKMRRLASTASAASGVISPSGTASNSATPTISPQRSASQHIESPQKRPSD